MVEEAFQLDLVLGDEKAKGIYRFYVEMKKKMCVSINMHLLEVSCLIDINHLALLYKRTPIYHNHSTMYNTEYELKAMYL